MTKADIQTLTPIPDLRIRIASGAEFTVPMHGREAHASWESLSGTETHVSVERTPARSSDYVGYSGTVAPVPIRTLRWRIHNLPERQPDTLLIVDLEVYGLLCGERDDLVIYSEAHMTIAREEPNVL